ncbi:MAG: hypothetical protein KJZ84_15520 [Bryobacteraceae bacterium]|nr:hypothetical protein [Bryobacteraceae bacterium]
MRSLTLILGLLAAAAISPATTIERMSMDEMIAKSTRIVRGEAVSVEGVRRGGMIYTDYTFRVQETLKGGPPETLRLSVPGGVHGAARQSFAGTPALRLSREYVVFVWTSRSGVNHIIGLSQGLFTAGLNEAGERVLRRGPASSHVVDKNGKEVADSGVELTWGELVRRVRGAGVVR